MATGNADLVLGRVARDSVAAAPAGHTFAPPIKPPFLRGTGFECEKTFVGGKLIFDASAVTR